MARVTTKTDRGTRETPTSRRSDDERAAGQGAGSHIGREVVGIAMLASSLFIGLGTASLQFGGGTLMGPCGAAVGLGCYALFGVGAYSLAALVAAWAVTLLRGNLVRPRKLVVLAYSCAVFFAAVLLHLATSQYRLRGYSTGGLLGEYGAEVMVSLLGTAGTLLVGVTGLLISAVATSSVTVRGLGHGFARLGRGGWSGLTRISLMAFPTHDEPSAAAPATSKSSDETVRLPAPADLTLDRKAQRRPDATQQVSDDAIEAEASVAPAVVAPAPNAPTPIVEERARRRRKSVDAATQQEVRLLGAGEEIQPPAAGEILINTPRIRTTPPIPSAAHAPVIVEGAPEIGDDEADRTDVSIAPEPIDGNGEATVPAIIAPVARTPIVEPRLDTRSTKGPLDYIRLGSGDFRLPDLSLLDYEPSGQGEIDRQAMLDLASRLEKTLADYGVKGRVSEIHPGPVVTMYEFVPQAGTKLSKITALSNDLAMALEALKVRIVAPIPGKAAVGIEVPNRVRETVYLKEIVGSENFAKSKSKLSMALGKDIAGEPVTVDMARMPHLLVAGTTGSGKSVSVNAMIVSMLMKASPEDVKLIMIDPKMLELSIYEGIPHLLLPVVTDPKKANLALRWAVDEMERRYELISKSGVRDIASYNKKIEKLAEKDEPAYMAARTARAQIKITVSDDEGEREIEVDPSEEAVRAAGGVVDEAMREEISAARAATQFAAGQHGIDALHNVPGPVKKLPFIVIIIDEFADLMMVASKEVEMSVARIAQKARAAGIHLILATQRPSVDVITGLIKANFPSRIAFQVASRIDARTILDQQGAESLLGMGDMLFTDRGLALKRVHGPLVTDTEINRVVDFLKAQGKPVYDLDILKPRADEEGGEGVEEDFADDMYDQAVSVVAEMRQASTSMLQRRLRLGYNRAARMIERMEREGIVGPADGAKPREVLVNAHAA